MSVINGRAARWLSIGLVASCCGMLPQRMAAQTAATNAAAISQTHPVPTDAVRLDKVGADAVAASAAGNGAGRNSARESFSMPLPASNQTLHIAVGHSMVLTSATPLRRMYVGNPDVLQTYTSGVTEIVLTPKIAGTSSLIVWDGNGGERLYTVSADLDPQSLRAALRDAFPGSTLSAETGDGRIYLSGTAPTEAASEGAVKLAQLFGKDIVNSIRVVPARIKQVELKLRIVEVDRTKLEQFGINIFTGGSNAISTSTQQFVTGESGVGTSAFTTADPLNLLFYNFSHAVGASIADLEQRDVLQVLAEPTLVTISGVPARFLSGGEFPVPVVQGGIGTTAAVTIVFRPYGVKVDFMPTVNDDGSIRLKISPEVSTLDYNNAVTISGFTIPALSTRRAETEVQIRDGQTFMVSGLLDHRTTESLSKVPGISSIPILGELFKSKNVDHSVVELVLLVTATVVDPQTSTDRPSEPRMSSPLMQSKTFDAESKSGASSKQTGGTKPQVDKP